MQELYIGMPLLSVLELTDTKYIQEEYRNYILNFCKEELKNGDNKITNEIELSILKSWFNNSNKIEMPKITDQQEFVDVFTEQKDGKTIIYEKYSNGDGTYYIKCITKDSNNIILKTSLAFKSASFVEIIENGGTEDYIFDTDNDGYANSRAIIKTKESTSITNDFNLDGKKD